MIYKLYENEFKILVMLALKRSDIRFGWDYDGDIPSYTMYTEDDYYLLCDIEQELTKVFNTSITDIHVTLGSVFFIEAEKEIPYFREYIHYISMWAKEHLDDMMYDDIFPLTYIDWLDIA